MQKKAVKMDTVVLEKPIRWTEMAFGRVDYIIVDLFCFHFGRVDCIIVDLFFLFSLTSKIWIT